MASRKAWDGHILLRTRSGPANSRRLFIMPDFPRCLSTINLISEMFHLFSLTTICSAQTE